MFPRTLKFTESWFGAARICYVRAQLNYNGAKDSAKVECCWCPCIQASSSNVFRPCCASEACYLFEVTKTKEANLVQWD
jgi:hypothetical protein